MDHLNEDQKRLLSEFRARVKAPKTTTTAGPAKTEGSSSKSSNSATKGINYESARMYYKKVSEQERDSFPSDSQSRDNSNLSAKLRKTNTSQLSSELTRESVTYDERKKETNRQQDSPKSPGTDRNQKTAHTTFSEGEKKPTERKASQDRGYTEESTRISQPKQEGPSFDELTPQDYVDSMINEAYELKLKEHEELGKKKSLEKPHFATGLQIMGAPPKTLTPTNDGYLYFVETPANTQEGQQKVGSRLVVPSIRLFEFQPSGEHAKDFGFRTNVSDYQRPYKQLDLAYDTSVKRQLETRYKQRVALETLQKTKPEQILSLAESAKKRLSKVSSKKLASEHKCSSERKSTSRSRQQQHQTPTTKKKLPPRPVASGRSSKTLKQESGRHNLTTCEETIRYGRERTPEAYSFSGVKTNSMKKTKT